MATKIEVMGELADVERALIRLGGGTVPAEMKEYRPNEADAGESAGYIRFEIDRMDARQLRHNAAILDRARAALAAWGEVNR